MQETRVTVYISEENLKVTVYISYKYELYDCLFVKIAGSWIYAWRI